MSILSSIGSYFATFFKALLGQLGAKISTFVHDFVEDDLGKIALDAVAIIQAEVNAGQLSSTDKTAIRDAAVAKFKADAATAGHDLSAFGTSLLNFMIETAYQALQSGVLPSLVAQAAITALKVV